MPEQFNKKDLEIILEVNKKAVEIETTVADQNEEIIGLLNDNQDQQSEINKKLDKIVEKSEETSKDLFKIRVLFITGILALIGQIIEIFIRK